jgi:hypothetical protein
MAYVMKVKVMKMYDAPFTLIEQMVEQSMKAKEDFIEDAVLKACMSCGVKIEREELIKLLTNDRKQYDKGYVDGVKDFAKRLKEKYFYDLERECLFEEDIDNLVKEMVGAE